MEAEKDFMTSPVNATTARYVGSVQTNINRGMKIGTDTNVRGGFLQMLLDLVVDLQLIWIIASMRLKEGGLPEVTEGD